MPFLIEIKKKIGAVQNTRKITKAMELVAASRMKAFQKKALGTRAYARGLLQALREAEIGMRDTAWGEQRTHEPVLFVIVTSDKGLCGALNQKLLRTLWQSQEWKKLPPDERLLVTIGRKSADAATFAGIPIAEKFEGLSENMSSLDALAIIDRILHYWTEKKCRKIVFISPHYVNPFVFYPTVKKYLPFSPDMVASHLDWKEGDLELPDPNVETVAHSEPSFFEPGKEEVVEKLARQLAQSLFLQAFYELKATEYSSRMVAMKNATEVADKVVKTLTVSYHKARQGAITQQLAELAGGAMAIQ